MLCDIFTRSRAMIRGSLLSVTFALGIVGCSTEPATRALSAPMDAAVYAKSTANTDVTVASASPDTGQQGTTIDVHVIGTGFAQGAVAHWRLRGIEDPTQVRTVSTRFVSSRELVATIEIGGNATVDSWDVAVTLLSGKNGVGSELFLVKPKDPTLTFKFPLADGALGLRGDGLYSDGTNSVYADGVCGVTGKLFATTEASNSGDATLQTDNPKSSNRKCAAYPRKVTLAYGDGVVERVTMFMNLHEIENTVYSIPVGSSALRSLGMAQLSASRCSGDKLQWGGGGNGDQLVVTRISVDTWQVTSQPAPNDRAYCVITGQFYHMPVQFTIVASKPVP